MKFDLSNYQDSEYCMHCLTENDAREFLSFLDSNGRTWCDGESYLKNTSYHNEHHGVGTYYYFNKGQYSTYESEPNDHVLLFDEFEWDFEDPYSDDDITCFLRGLYE